MAKVQHPPPPQGQPAPPLPTDSGTAATDLDLDTPEVRAAIAQAYEDRCEIRKQQAKLSADLRAIMEGLVARGLDRQAVIAAFAHKDKEGERAARFASSYAIGANALQLELNIAATPPTKH